MPRGTDDCDRRETLGRAVEDARANGACYLVLLLALARLLAAVRRFWEMYDAGAGDGLAYDARPLEYLARHFQSMLGCECPAAALDQLSELEEAPYEALEGMRLEQLVAGMNENVADMEAELAEAEGAPEPDAVCEGRAS